MVRYLVSILTLFSIESAWAYPTPVDFSGKLSRWDVDAENPTVFYRVQGADQYDESFFGAIADDAAVIWSDVPTSIIQIQQAANDQKEHILIKLKSSLTGAPLSAGFSTFDEYDSNDLPLHCTIEILTTLSYGTFATTLLHEIGHCIGLGHSLIPESIMSYSLSATEFSLDTDDIAAVSRLYPIDGQEPALPPGCAITSKNTHPQKMIWFFVLPIIVAALRRAKDFKYGQRV